MMAMKLWFSLSAPWIMGAASLAGIAAGILLRRFVPKQKILILFVSFLAYMFAEYTVTQAAQPVSTAGCALLGGMAGMIFLGSVLPSIFARWELKDEKEDEKK